MMQTVLPPCPSLPGPLCDDTDFLMFDNFPGPVSAVNGPPAKVPVIGDGTWQVTGEHTANAVSGGGNLALNVDVGNAYAQIALGDTPGEIGCTFEYVGPLPENGPTPTLACYPTFNMFAQNNFHFQVTPRILAWTYWKNGAPSLLPAWSIQNRYAISSNTFYTFRVFIDPPYAFGFLFDSMGTLIGHIAINEPNMAGVIGQHLFVQLFSKQLNYRSVWARKRSPSALAQASLVRAGALHAGEGTPSGVLSARYDATLGYLAPRIAATRGDAEFGISAESAGAARLVLSRGLPPWAITAASIANAGAGYQMNDLLTVQGGTVHAPGAPAQLRVDSVGAGGAVTAISVATPGLYDSPPPPGPDGSVGVDSGNARFILANSGTSTLSSKIELGVSLDMVFRNVNDNASLAIPRFNGSFGSDFPYVPGGIRVGGAAGPLWLSGQGSPEGQITAPVGSLFSRTNGGAGTTLYVKETGIGNTGWVAK